MHGGYGATHEGSDQHQQLSGSPSSPSQQPQFGVKEGVMVRFVKKYISVLFYLRYPILLTWGLLIFICAFAGANLTNSLKAELSGPSDTPSAIANRIYAHYFPAAVNTTQYLVYVDSNAFRPFDLGSDSNFYAFDSMLQYWLMTGRSDFNGSTPEAVKTMNNVTSTLVIKDPTKRPLNVSIYSSARTMIAQNFYKPSIFDYFGAGNFSTLIVIAVDFEPSDPKSMEFYHMVMDKVQELYQIANLTAAHKKQISFQMLGMPAFLDEINSSSGRDVVVMFGVVVPIALIIFCWSLDSLRLGILALCSLITTLIGTFAVLDGVARSVDISSVTPGIVGALSIALSSDFTYMLCSKFRREVVLESAHFFDDPSGVTRGVVFVDPKHVMIMVMAYAGRVVTITGTSVAFASLGLACFPLSTFSSIGIGCIICAVLASITSLVLTPTLLVTFYRFFATGAEHCEYPTFWGSGASSLSRGSTAYSAVDSSTTSLTSSQQQEQQQQQQQQQPQQKTSDGAQPTAATTAAADNKGNKNNNNLNATAAPPNAAGVVIPGSAPSFSGSQASPSSPYGATEAVNNKDHPQQHHQQEQKIAAAQQQQQAAAATTGGDPMNLPAVSLSREAVSRAELQLHDKRVFYRDFTAFLSQPVVAVISILIVTALCLYPMTRAFDGNYSNAMEQFLPRDSQLVPAWNGLRRTFKVGDIFPYSVIVNWTIPNRSKADNMIRAVGNVFGLCDEAVVKHGQAMIHQIMTEVEYSNPAGVNSEWFDNHLVDVPGGHPNITAGKLKSCLFKMMPDPDKTEEEQFAALKPDCKFYIVQINMHTSVLTNMTTVQDFGLNLAVTPTSKEGKQWIRAMRAKLQEMEEQYRNIVFNYTHPDPAVGGNVSLYLRGYGADSLDLLDFANDNFELVVGLLIGAAWLVVTLFFFSLGASIRLLLSLVFTLFTCFGLATMVFTDGAMSDWPVPDGLKGQERGLAWLVPFSAIVLNVATVLNYDVSATIRVQQFRHMGIATRSAIIIAAIEGSNEVFIAAIMTMVSFAGLLFSQVPVMNQLGFFFIMGAFLQGIIFRLFLVVPVMSLLGDLNWFPYMQIAEKCGGVDYGSYVEVDGGDASQQQAAALLSSGGGVTSSSGGDGSLRDTGASAVPRMSGVLAPPLATAAIEDNEAVLWAARESGFDGRRFSSALHAGGGAAGMMRGSGYVRSSAARSGSNSLSGSQARPPLEFHFTPGSSTAFSHQQQQHQQKGGGGQRSSIAPDENGDAASMSRLSGQK